MKGTGQTARVSCISFIVIWPGFDSTARLIPATLQRDMLYDEQAPSSCSFDRHFQEYASAVQNGNSGRQGCIHCMHFSHYMHYSHFMTYANYTKCIHYFTGSSSKGTVVKKISMLNKNLVHLIDDIFWTMGFKTETQANKVVPITDNTPIIFKYINYITCSNYFLISGQLCSSYLVCICFNAYQYAM